MPTMMLVESVFYDEFKDEFIISICRPELGCALYNGLEKLYNLTYIGEL